MLIENMYALHISLEVGSPRMWESRDIAKDTKLNVDNWSVAVGKKD